MKGIWIHCLLASVTVVCVGQQPQNSFASAAPHLDRLSVVKSSIEIPVWHERSFWPLYQQFLEEETKASASAYRALYDLASLDQEQAGSEGFEYGRRLIGYRSDELALRKRYYAEIGAGFNGVIALQFLQTETLVDMMESFRIYDATPWKNYRFNSAAIPSQHVFQAKVNMLTAALSVSGQEAVNLRAIYSRYERECNDLLGEGYDIYSLYAGEPSDFTPALAKRLGYDLLQLAERELKLKEKYFLEMNQSVGSRLAAGFLAWEDYYSLVSKMHVWADAP